MRRAVGEVYRRLVFRRPGAIDGRVVSTFASHAQLILLCVARPDLFELRPEHAPGGVDHEDDVLRLLVAGELFLAQRMERGGIE